ncbi:MAG: penicillin-binding protein activator [candidate division WOR-3 bacterium]|nr:penicillin-binding protein activator [candidate division WOR-3 bacterium]MCX7947720.1 penicillin-binding protein activator [candidate division WOR-3 bacterium]MDW8150357.1 penicillin-binding protein activator [candidate division WOR-3 bacterium]
MRKLILLLSIIVLSCAPQKAKIMVALPLEGSGLSYGLDARDGINLAVLNLGEKNIQFSYCDTEGNADKFVECYEKAKKEGANFVIGPILTREINEKAIELINKYKIPVISPSISTDEIFNKSEYIFAVAASNSIIASNLAFVLNSANIREVIIVLDPNSEYSKDITEREKKAFEKFNIKVVDEVNFRNSRSDLINDLKASIAKFSKPQAKRGKEQAEIKNAIILNIYAVDLDKILLDIRNELKYTGVLAGPDAWDEVKEKTQPISGENFYIAHFFPLENQKTTEFTKQYESQFKKLPSSWSALSYDAMSMLINAIREAKAVETQRIILRMKYQDYEGLTGRITYGGDNRPDNKSVVVIKYSGDTKGFLRRTNVAGTYAQ